MRQPASRARPFGRGNGFRGERGRWPDCETCPPGGGCGAVAKIESPFFSDRIAAASFYPRALESASAVTVLWAEMPPRQCGRRSTVARPSPSSHTRRRAAWTYELAAFHAGPAPTSSVRRDTQARTCCRGHASTALAKPDPRERCPSCARLHHAQAKRDALTCLPSRNLAATHRRCRVVGGGMWGA